jgi:hypothetical protein
MDRIVVFLQIYFHIRGVIAQLTTVSLYLFVYDVYMGVYIVFMI